MGLLSHAGLDCVFRAKRLPLPDALGSTLALAMTDGSFAVSYAYEPYSAATISGDPVGYPYTYTGREDDGTGLYYYRARYYSPEYGRFISEDPIGFAGGLNFYAYVGGNPVSLTYPTGFQIAVPVPLPAMVPRPIPFPIDPVLPVPDYFRPDLTDEDKEFCRKERMACAKLCAEVMDDPDGCNVYGGSIEKCIRGCLPFICGGNRV